MEQQKKSEKRGISPSVMRVLQDLQILVWGLLATVLTVFFVLELWPQKNIGLKIADSVEVSSSLVRADGGLYSMELSGKILNTSGQTVEAESVLVCIGDGKNEKEVELGALSFPPRTEKELSFFGTETTAYDRVLEVSVTVDGERYTLSNITTSSLISGLAIFYLVLLVPVIFLLVRSIKIRYYMYQESLKIQRPAEKTES